MEENYGWQIPRFFVTPDNIHDGFISLSIEDSEHIRSLRLRPDELFIICDGNGCDYVCRLSGQQADARIPDGVSAAQIINKQKTLTEPSVHCAVYIAYAKGERLDYAVQKSVELGADKIALYTSKRCVARPHNIKSKTDRLQRIALETAKQSKRGVVPEVSDAGSFGQMVDMAATDSDLAMLCYEDEKSLHLMTVLERYFPLASRLKDPMIKIKSLAVITGPEGGFEAAEVEFARLRDISVISLGPRILRSETAPAAALAAIMYHTGNM